MADKPGPPKLGGELPHKAEEMGEPHSIMCFGLPKRGKTTLAARIAEVEGFNNVLIIDCETGAGAIAATYPNVDVRVVNNWIEFNRVFNDALKDEAQAYYDCIIIDTMSTLQRWITSHSSGGKKAEHDDWAFTYDKIMEIMWAMHRMDAVGITLVHTKTSENKLTHEIWTQPWVQGSAAVAMGNVPDLIIYLDVKNSPNGPVRTLQLAPKKSMLTGSRYEDRLPTIMEDALLPDLYAIIRGAETS